MILRKPLLIFGLALFVNMLVLQSSAHAARRAVLIDPEIMEYGCKLSMTQAENVIKAGLRAREWTYKLKKRGHIEGRILVRGKHTLWVDISYTQRTFDINYKDSDNLNYQVKDDGTRYLHPNANSWMTNLESSILNNAYDICP